jgi:hypothetical protein
MAPSLPETYVTSCICGLIHLIHTKMKMFRWCGLELVYIPTHTLIRSFPKSFSNAPLCLMCLLIFSQNTVGQFSISSMVNASVCSGPALNPHSRGFQGSFLLGETWVQSNGIPKSLCLHGILSNKIYLAFRLLGFYPVCFLGSWVLRCILGWQCQQFKMNIFVRLQLCLLWILEHPDISKKCIVCN